MSAYRIDEDILDQKQGFLTICLGVSALLSLLVGGLLFAAYNARSTSVNNDNLLVWFGFICSLGLSGFFQRTKRFTLAAWVYLASLMAIAVYSLWTNGLSPDTAALFFVPLILSVLLVDKRILWVTALCMGLLAVGVIHQFGFLSALPNLFIQLVVMGLFAGAVIGLSRNNLGLVEWAVDSEQKKTQQADMYYKQGEQLKQALSDLQHASAELEMLNQKLGEAYTSVERASKAKSTFLSNMSHELRTPLNVIIGYASSMLNMPQMYNNQPLAEIYRTDIQLIQDNGQYLVGLINDILDLSKIEAGRLELHCEATPLDEVLKGTISTSIGLLRGKSIQIIPDFAEGLPRVWADPMRVRQIILNLMSNAIKFTETGSVKLSARLEGQFVRIAVKDTGIGIPAAALPVIFDRFKQAQQDTDKQYGGTGLGLDISQQLSRMHGGELTVKSVVGQGSTFSFTLPLATAAQVQTPVESINLNTGFTVFEEAPADAAFSQVILLAEDNSDTRALFHRTLENGGYIVVETHDGAQIMELATGLLPALIILDVHLPHKSGQEVLVELKAHPDTASIPVMVCTVDNNDQTFLDLGASAFVHKPVTPENLLDQVQKLLTTIPN
ncbi:MAG TPA: ATP-binding protein [Phototrophicaceae bacterium]|nr:ATP-binding protein [Phototrophicaceae bacterium]